MTNRIMLGAIAVIAALIPASLSSPVATSLPNITAIIPTNTSTITNVSGLTPDQSGSVTDLQVPTSPLVTTTVAPVTSTSDSIGHPDEIYGLSEESAFLFFNPLPFPLRFFMEQLIRFLKQILSQLDKIADYFDNLE
ncbi:uncharacterized protein [Fopius arisanus]|uniref:Uncharacterized protein n=2 Tax=Fopius arisanus TaxID=64838 RepID=A0A9R1TP47_9HYME|nr:PREDICTED: uncharacterized protein LOC105272572 [Fopius arisanus]